MPDDVNKPADGSPTPVEVTNVVKTEPAPEAAKPAPTVEKVVETHTTTSTKGDMASLVIQIPLATFDDKVRAALAAMVFVGFLSFVFWVTIRPAQLPGDTLGIILGAFISLNGIVIGFYYQSSSGSNAKDADARAKKPVETVP